MRKPYLLSIQIAVLVFCLLGTAAALPDGAPAPEFSAQDASGKMRSLSEFRGKIVVLNFWATWCPACKEELAAFEKIHKKYQQSGVVVLAVATDSQGWSEVSSFLAGRKLEFPVLLGTPHICRLYGGIESLPRTFFLDRQGRIVSSVNSALTEEALDRVLKLMQQN